MKVGAAGVDTWSVAWYVEPDDVAYDALEAMATVPAGRGARLLPDEVEGHRVGWFPAAGLAFAEGHPRPGGLAGAGDLVPAFERLDRALRDRGIHFTPGRSRGIPHGASRPVAASGFAGVRRLDLTVDLYFERGCDGLAALHGVSALPVPRVKKATVTEKGGRRLETVYYMGQSGRRLARWYDKGVESGKVGEGVLERGQLIRPEDQRRFAKDARLGLEHLQAPVLRGLFQKRFMPLWQASKGVSVASVDRIAVRLRELQEAGEITPGQAKAIAGHLVLQRAGAHLQAPRTVRADAALARRYGLVLAADDADEVDVDLHEVLEACLEAEAWYGDS